MLLIAKVESITPITPKIVVLQQMIRKRRTWDKNILFLLKINHPYTQETLGETLFGRSTHILDDALIKSSWSVVSMIRQNLVYLHMRNINLNLSG